MVDVSVIVPTYNEEKYVSETLRSVRSQKTNLDFELIVSDSNSTDNTVSISEKYADKVISLKKRGIWLGRNEGGKKASAKLLVFVDADTSLPKNYLDVVYSVMQDRSVSGLSCAFRFDNGKTPFNIMRDVSNHYLLFLGCAGRGELLGFNNVMRKVDFLSVGGFPNKPLEDGAMARKLHKLGRVIYLPEPKVVTSARRMNHSGALNAIKYYANLMWVTYQPNFLLNNRLGRIMGDSLYKPIR